VDEGGGNATGTTGGVGELGGGTTEEGRVSPEEVC